MNEIKTRTCPKCKRKLPATHYHKGWWKCKDCGKIESLLPHRVATKRAYNRTYVKTHYNSLIATARAAVGYAIKTGRLVPPESCQSCGTIPTRRDGKRAIQAHHHNGYKDQLNVTWLCQCCHAQTHLNHANQ
jgi:hypothetical protein